MLPSVSVVFRSSVSWNAKCNARSMSEIYRTGVTDHLVRVLMEDYESGWHPMVDTMREGSDNDADWEAYCTYCKKVVAIDSDYRCQECKWPIDERGDLGASPVDQDTVARNGIILRVGDLGPVLFRRRTRIDATLRSAPSFLAHLLSTGGE